MTENIKINKFALYGNLVWTYIKYQIVTKMILGIVLLPSFSWLTNTLIHMSGRTNLSSGDYLGFLFSLYGLPIIIMGILLLILILGVDINTFIITSSLFCEGKFDFKIKEVFIAAIKSTKVFISPLGIILVLYTAFILPILGLGIKMGPLKNFKIPNFITSVIFNNKLYSTAYYILLTFLLVLTIIYIFSLHFILIEGVKVRKGFKNSRLFMKKYWKRFIKDFIVKVIKLIFISLCIIAIMSLLLLGLDLLISKTIVSIDNIYDDVQGNVEAGQLDVALYCARRIVLNVMFVVLMKNGIFIDREKWVSLKFSNLCKVNKSFSVLNNTFKVLFRGDLRQEIECNKAIVDEMSVSKQVIETILMEELQL